MSVAFVREPNDTQAVETLPDREVSAEPNFVTARGLRLIESEIEGLNTALGEAQAADDKMAVATLNRDLRYWNARRASAEVIATMPGADEVHFGSRVTIERDDGRRQVFQIVGQDEADPTEGLLSYVSPLAKSLVRKRVGDVVVAGHGEAEIVAIEAAE
ncbi:transcription elongation factor GreB [Aureimonas sp. SA4125]|uniref:transcription elongation factor GreA n=1 Tax=Aureimonas sp. SA4125 TaxID=2826993 RepID=UPI001CC4A105|nr:transcription elongation factor GreA [Aureimonas sp. SA4125]BDA85033.1 transcription elongation factor GreB [Aureimonas sp. SA4125]